MLLYTPLWVETQSQQPCAFIISSQDFTQHLQVWQHPYGQIHPRNKRVCHQPPPGRFSLLCKAKSILLETTARAHTNTDKNHTGIKFVHTNTAVPCSSAFHQLCLKPQPKEFPFVVAKTMVSPSELLILSSLCHPQRRRCQLMLLFLSTSSSSLGGCSSKTGADLCANTCVPTANLREFS